MSTYNSSEKLEAAKLGSEAVAALMGVMVRLAAAETLGAAKLEAAKLEEEAVLEEAETKLDAVRKLKAVFEKEERLAAEAVFEEAKKNASPWNKISHVVAASTTPARIHHFWDLAARIIPSKTRKDCFEPAYEDLKREHFLDRKKFRGKWERRWLKSCFCWHAFRMIIQSLRVWVSVKIVVLAKGVLSIFTW